MSFYSLAGKKLKVTLELPDGGVLSGLVFAASFEQSMLPIDVTHRGSPHRELLAGDDEWKLELLGIGQPLWTGTRKEATERQREFKSALEWECDYCGAVWPKAATQCVQCGGHRSFLYDV